MKKLLIVASVLACACAAASADPKPAPAPAPKQAPIERKCMPEGKPIFEGRKSNRSGGDPTETHAIYANGAYTADATDKDGKSEMHITGQCYDDKQVDAAKAALKDAAWTVTTARIKCMAMSNDMTTYTASGKEVFVETLCSGKSLDAKSADALAKLKDVLKGPAASQKK